MSKNFAALYASANDSIALDQKFYLKQETTRGTLIAPTGADFLFTLNGGSANFTQPIESSPHRSGRHHTSIIKKKTETNWTIPTFFNVDTTLGAPGVAAIDPAMRLLWKSLMGNESVGLGYPVYNPTTPDVTFSIFEVGDVWAKQVPGAFVEGCNASLPGDGEAQMEWSGSAKTSLLVGIGQSNADNNAGNSLQLEAGDGQKFPVGALVMIVKNDGTTRSTDTPDGAPRRVTTVAGDVVTVDGAVLADADGSVDPVYLAYYEPETPTAINDPQTGLVGSIDIAGFGSIDSCVRSLGLNMVNNHELQDFCYGEEGLGGALFTPGGRFTAELTLELNLNKELVAYLNNLKSFGGDDITVVLGDSASRHYEFLIPKAIFPIPEISVPDTGTIPVTFTGNCYQSALDAADEVTVSVK